MIQRILAAACFALLSWLPVSAYAQSTAPVYLPGGCGTGNISGNADAYTTVNGVGQFCVTASVSVSGFTPNGNFANLTASGSSGSVALPSASAVVAFQNTGTTTVSCTMGIGSATATTNEIQVPASSTVFVTVGSNTFGACIDQTGSTSNLVVLAGGTGLGAGFGGGGGGSGGTTNITQVAGTAVNATIAAAGGLPIDALTGGNLLNAINSATPAGTNVIGFTSNDPCAQGVKLNAPIATSAGNFQIVAGVASKKVYICSIFVAGASAWVGNIIEGTGAACTTANEAAVIGSTTAASGMSFSANSGWAQGNGGGTMAVTATAANGICLLQSGTVALAGNMTYVQQ